MPDMASLDPDPTKLTISSCATRCHGSFQRCLSKAASFHPRELALIENQLAKFSLWTAYFQVFGSGRESLDHRLRESFDIQDAIIEVVEALSYSVLKCTSILETSTPVVLNIPLPDINAKFKSTLQDITKQIALLHKFSGIIRRLGRETQDLTDINAFKIKDKKGDDLESFMREDFARHIRNQFPGVSDTIQQRLVNTMILRHKKVLYRRFCSGRFPDRPIKPSDPSEVATKSSFSAFRSVAMGNHGDNPFPPAPCGNIMRKYDILKKQRRKEYKSIQENENSDPEIIKKYEGILEKDWNEILQAAGELDCPFCCLSLPARDVVDENKWKLHIKSDIDSYVCLFEGCESPEEVYNNSSTWLKHMSSHYMQWRCVSKSHPEFQSTTKSEYVEHMKVFHPGKFTDAQLNILATRNARPMVSMFKPCPLCGNEEFDGNRADHVAGHLLLLALKSLPNYEEHIEGREESVYQQPHLSISNTRSKSTIRQDSRNDSNFIVVHAAGTQSSSVPKKEETVVHRSVGIPPRQQQHLQRWQERFNSQQDSFINTMDDVEFERLSPAKHASQNHLEPMNKDEEKERDGKKDRNTAEEKFNDDALPTASYHEQVLGQEAVQQGNAGASSNIRSPGRVLNIDMAPKEYLREMERDRGDTVQPISSLADVDAGLALRSTDNTDSTNISMSQHPMGQGLSIPTAITRDNSIISNSAPRENNFDSNPMARENSVAPMVESQDFGGVTQWLQSWTDDYEKRNETACILTDSFYWDDTRLTNEGIPLLDRQHIAPGDGSPSSMNMNNFVQIMDNSNATETHDQWSFESLLAMDRSDNDLGKLPQQQSTARAKSIIKSQRDSTSLDETLHSSDSDDHGHIASLAGFDSRPPRLTVESILKEMSKELDALYRRTTNTSDASNHMPNILDSADESLLSLSADSDADRLQRDFSGASDKHRLFMCPYAMRYPDRVNHSCFQRLNTIPYLKQHLRQSHHDTTSCPHQCRSRRPAAVSRRSKLNAPLCFDSNACLQINKQRSDRSKTYRQQWERIYQVLYPEADRIPDPYIGELTIKRLRSIFQFMETHGLKYLTSVYHPILVDPDAEIMYQTAFCKWLPQVFEWRFPPQGQQLLGDFLNQINSVLCDNYYRLEYPSGARRENVMHFSSASKMSQHDPFYNTSSQHGTMLGQQPSRHTNPSTLPPQQQIPTRSSKEDSLYRSQHNTSSDMPSYTNTVRPHENMDWLTPMHNERLSGGQNNIHQFQFTPQNPTQGSHSHYSTDPPVNMEGVETSQMGTWKSPF